MAAKIKKYLKQKNLYVFLFALLKACFKIEIPENTWFRGFLILLLLFSEQQFSVFR
jgi:hypothetical protein